MFLVTSANRQESLLAIPLLLLTVACFGFSITIVRADAGYFTTPIMNFIRGSTRELNDRLPPAPPGQPFLGAPLLSPAVALSLGPRASIERHFAWAKRYFGLESARWRGWVAAYQHTALVYSVRLGVALVAHRYQRPELAGSRAHVLAIKTVQ